MSHAVHHVKQDRVCKRTHRICIHQRDAKRAIQQQRNKLGAKSLYYHARRQRDHGKHDLFGNCIFDSAHARHRYIWKQDDFLTAAKDHALLRLRRLL